MRLPCFHSSIRGFQVVLVTAVLYAHKFVDLYPCTCSLHNQKVLDVEVSTSQIQEAVLLHTSRAVCTALQVKRNSPPHNHSKIRKNTLLDFFVWKCSGFLPTDRFNGNFDLFNSWTLSSEVYDTTCKMQHCKLQSISLGKISRSAVWMVRSSYDPRTMVQCLWCGGIMMAILKII